MIDLLRQISQVTHTLGHEPSLEEAIHADLPLHLYDELGGFEMALKLTETFTAMLGESVYSRDALPALLGGQKSPREVKDALIDITKKLSSEASLCKRVLRLALNDESLDLLHFYLDLQQNIDRMNGALTAMRHFKILSSEFKPEPDMVAELRGHIYLKDREIAKLQKALEEKPVKAPEPPKGTSATLDALRQRDEYRRQLEHYKKLSEDLALGGSGQDGRTTDVLLSHFRSRLNERFGLTISWPELQAINNHQANIPTHSYTNRGDKVKALTIGGQTVYAIITRNCHGVETLTTAYTEDMLPRSEYARTI